MRGRRIGIDIRALTPPVTGTGVYLREILAQIAELAPDNDYYCYTTKEAAGNGLPRGSHFHMRVGRGATARWGTIWLQTGIVRDLRRDGLDLFWGPLQVAPIPILGRLPTVVTLHDLVFDLYPETMSRRNRLALRFFARRSLRGADAVLADSAATAAAAQEKLGVAAERLTVVHLAAGRQFVPQPPHATRARVEEAFGLEGEYLLFVGTQEPRKNLDGLLRAVSRLLETGRFDADVVLAGTSGWKTSSLLTRLSDGPVANRVRALGYVDDEVLPALYGAARVLVMPSHYEGFGLPVLEAMSCGTPVVCSDAPPFPEITGGAARLCRTGDDSALAEAIAAVWNDDELRLQLSRRGRERALQFSWRRAAEAVLASFEALLEKRPAVDS